MLCAGDIAAECAPPPAKCPPQRGRFVVPSDGPASIFGCRASACTSAREIERSAEQMKVRCSTGVPSLRPKPLRRDLRRRAARRAQRCRRAYRLKGPDVLRSRVPGESPELARRRAAMHLGSRYRNVYCTHLVLRSMRSPEPPSPGSDHHGGSLRMARPRGAGRPRALASRSSSRGGDSGDDGPGSSDPEPVSARRLGRRACVGPLACGRTA